MRSLYLCVYILINISKYNNCVYVSYCYLKRVVIIVTANFYIGHSKALCSSCNY